MTTCALKQLHALLLITSTATNRRLLSTTIGNVLTAISAEQSVLFHYRTRTAYLYNGCLEWYNVLVTSWVHSSMKLEFPKVQRTKYTAADWRDGRISVLNHCLSWSKFVNTHLSHSRQWFNIHVYFCVRKLSSTLGKTGKVCKMSIKTVTK